MKHPLPKLPPLSPGFVRLLSLLGSAVMAGPSFATSAFPTNTTLLFSRGLDGQPGQTVSVVSGDGRNEAPLVAGGWPVLSPDGRFFLYHADNPSTARGNLYRFELSTGTSLRVVQQGDYLVGADWTPDGTRLVFDEGCTLNTSLADGSQNHVYLSADCYDDAPAVNPVSGQIVCHNINVGLIITDPDGSNRHVVPKTARTFVWPAWSPDGKSLTAVDHDQVLRIAPDGTGITNLLALATPALTVTSYRNAWTPDGQWIVFGGTTGGTNGLWAVATDGSGTLRSIPTAAGATIAWVGSIVSGDLTTNYTRVVAELDLDQSVVVPGGTVDVVGRITNFGPGAVGAVTATNRLPAKSKVSQLTLSQGTFAQVGDSLIFQASSLPAGGALTFHFTLAPSTPGAQTLSLDATASGLNGIGSQLHQIRVLNVGGAAAQYAAGLVYNTYSNGTYGVWFAPSDGSPDQLITAGGKGRISPDGSALVFERDGDILNHHGNVYLRNLVSGAETKIVSNGDFIVGLDFTGDSKSVVFDYACEVDQASRDGSNRVRIDGADCYDDAPAINYQTGQAVLHNQYQGLLLFNGTASGTTDWSSRRTLPNSQPGDYWPTWSADGKWVAFNRGNNWYKIRPDGSGRTQLTFFPSGLPAVPTPNQRQPSFGTWGAGSWSSDGRLLFAPGILGGTFGILAIDSSGVGGATLWKAVPNTIVVSTSTAYGPVSGTTTRLDVPFRFLAQGAAGVPVFGPVGQKYVLELSVPLQGWTPVHTNAVGANYFGYTLYPGGLVLPHEFFRARWLP